MPTSPRRSAARTAKLLSLGRIGNEQKYEGSEDADRNGEGLVAAETRCGIRFLVNIPLIILNSITVQTLKRPLGAPRKTKTSVIAPQAESARRPQHGKKAKRASGVKTGGGSEEEKGDEAGRRSLTRALAGVMGLRSVRISILSIGRFWVDGGVRWFRAGAGTCA